MATFPALKPNAGRNYNLGATPVALAEVPNGDVLPFLWADGVQGIPIAFRFEGQTLAEADQVQDHYLGQRGGMVPFDLPAAVWQAHASTDDVFPDGTLFRYAGPPKRSVNQAGFYDVEVSLIQA